MPVALFGSASPASATVTTIVLQDAADPIRIAIDDAGYAYTVNPGRLNVSRIQLSDRSVVDDWAKTGLAPFDLAIDSAGNIYTSNGTSNNVTKITPEGVSSGTGPNYEWAPAGDSPYGIAVGPGGYVYVANYGDGTVTRIAPNGASSGESPEYVWAPTGHQPTMLALNSSGDLFATTSDGLTKIAPDGTSSGTAPEYRWAPTGFSPFPVAIDWAENVYTGNKVSGGLTRVTPAGVPSGSAPGYEWASLPDGSDLEAMVIDSQGNLYTANTRLNTVSKIAPNGTTQLLAVTGDVPAGLALDSVGNLYTANYGDDTVTKISPGGGTPDIAPAPPAEPSTPTATAGNGTATVTVPANPPSSRYGTPSSYTVNAVEDPLKSCTVTPPATSCELTGLANGTAYTFTARANLNAWQTAASAASGAVTPLAPTYQLSAIKSGTGTGTVTSSPAGIDCGSTCQANFDEGTNVTLSASATSGSTFSGWSGACSGTGSCAVTMSEARSVTATFTADPPPPPPTSTVTVSNLKAKVTGKSVLVTSKVKVSGAGKIAQRATTGKGRKARTWCRASKTVSAAGTHSLQCNLGSKGRKALRKGALKLTLRTTFTPIAGEAVTADRKLDLKRRR